MKFKRIASAVASLFLIVPSVAVISACSSTGGAGYSFTVQSSPFKTMNYLADAQSDSNSHSLYNSFMEGLVTSAPNYGGDNINISNIIGLKPITIKQLNDYKPGMTQGTSEFINKNMASDDSFANLPIAYTDTDPWFAVTYGSADELAIANGGSGWNVLFARIRSDAKWHNGKPVTANDFAATVQYLNDDKMKGTLKNNSFQKIPLANSEVCNSKSSPWDTNNPCSIDKIGTNSTSKNIFQEVNEHKTIGVQTFTDKTKHDWIVYDFKKPFAASANKAGGIITGVDLNSRDGFLPINDDFVKSLGSGSTDEAKRTSGIKNFGIQDPKSIMGNGPYNVDYTYFDYEIGFSKADNYWDRKKVLNNGFRLRVVSNPLTASIMFRAGQIALGNLAPELITQFLSDPKMQPFIVQAQDNSPAWFLSFNLSGNNNTSANTKKALSNAHFRKALQFAINRKDVAYALDSGGGMSGDMLGATATMEPLARQDNNGNLRNDLVYNDGSPKYNISFNPLDKSPTKIPVAWGTTTQRIYYHHDDMKADQTDYIYNQTLAKQEFQKFRAEDPDVKLPISLNLIYNSALSLFTRTSGTIAQSINATLGTNNVEVNLRALPQSQFESRMQSKNFDSLLYCFACDQGTNREDKFTSYYAPFDGNKIDNSTPGTKGQIGTDGSINNPTGSWVWADAFKEMDKNPAEKNSFLALLDSFAKKQTLSSIRDGKVLYDVMDTLFNQGNVLFDKNKKSPTKYRYDYATAGITKAQFDATKEQAAGKSVFIPTDVHDALKNLSDFTPSTTDTDSVIPPLKGMSVGFQNELYFGLEVILKEFAPVANLLSSLVGYAMNQTIGSAYNPQVYTYTYMCSSPPKNGYNLPNCNVIQYDDTGRIYNN